VTDDRGAFDSRALAPGAAFSFRFQAPGTVDYRCTIHQEMRGQIVVTASGY
jgi:plastocyanin